MSYYDKDYFAWQKDLGKFGGVANLFKFREHVLPNHRVLDFGCGGGYLLKNLPCAARYGVEINPAARSAAEENGVKTFATSGEVPDETVDVLISNHALEHVFNPHAEIVELRKKLILGGVAVFVVPHNSYPEEWMPNDVHKHLYTWNRLTLGNLFSVAGFAVDCVELIQHQWPSGFEELFKRHGEAKFHELCRREAKKNNIYQVKIVARREGD
ncbi:MAG TPA: class I SAM-dependent methyltransferase [bacterium]|nr:class I SAM-dependent methyltransferase [bacterium]